MSDNSKEERKPVFTAEKKPWWYMSARQIGVAAAFAGMALAITLSHISIPIPGLPGGGGMDPSEIIRSIGSAMGGPLVGAIIGIFGSVSSLVNVINHIPSTIVIGFLYKYIYGYKKTTRMVMWVGLIALYYIILIPNIALTVVVEYMKADMSEFVPMIVTILPGIAPEFIIVCIVTTLIWAALPEKYTKPLW